MDVPMRGARVDEGRARVSMAGDMGVREEIVDGRGEDVLWLLTREDGRKEKEEDRFVLDRADCVTWGAAAEAEKAMKVLIRG